MARDTEKKDPRRLRSTTRANERRLARANKQLKRVVEKTAGKGATAAQAQSVAADEGNVRLVKKIQKKEDKAKFQARKAGPDTPAKKERKKISLPQIGKGGSSKSGSPDFSKAKHKKPKYSKSGGNPNMKLGDKVRMALTNLSCKNKAKKGGASSCW